MFCLTKVKGKGLGFVALKKIKLGTLILKEEPCLLLHPEFSESGWFSLHKLNTTQHCHVLKTSVKWVVVTERIMKRKTIRFNHESSFWFYFVILTKGMVVKNSPS